MVRRKATQTKPARRKAEARDAVTSTTARPSSLIDTRVIYRGDSLVQLPDLPDACIDLICIDPPFNSNRNYEVFWGKSGKKPAFEDRHAGTQPSIDSVRPRRVEPARANLRPLENNPIKSATTTSRRATPHQAVLAEYASVGNIG